MLYKPVFFYSRGMYGEYTLESIYWKYVFRT